MNKLNRPCLSIYSYSEDPQEQQANTSLAIVRIHDACPAFSKRIFKFTDDLDWMGKS